VTSDYRMLAEELSCPPDLQCPKVALDGAEGIVIVGGRVTDPDALAALGVGAGEAAVRITKALYRSGSVALDEGRTE